MKHLLETVFAIRGRGHRGSKITKLEGGGRREGGHDIQLFVN